jgi:hypothetical protein
MIPIAAFPSEIQLFMATTDACSSSASGRTGCVAEWSCPASGMVASFLGIWIIFGTKTSPCPKMRTILAEYSPMFDTVDCVFCALRPASGFCERKKRAAGGSPWRLRFRGQLKVSKTRSHGGRPLYDTVHSVFRSRSKGRPSSVNSAVRSRALGGAIRPYAGCDGQTRRAQSAVEHV